MRDLIVFGARARGDSEADSDLDVAAIVEEKCSDLEEKSPV